MSKTKSRGEIALTEESAYRLYEHRQDDSILLVARILEDGSGVKYEARWYGETDAFTLDAETFQAIKGVAVTESENGYEGRHAVEPEQYLQAMQQAAMRAEAGELTLYRRLVPYLDAEIENRDAEIEGLTARVAELEAEVEARPSADDHGEKVEHGR